MILFQPYESVAFGLAVSYENKNDTIQLMVYEYGIIWDLIDHIFTKGLR